MRGEYLTRGLLGFFADLGQDLAVPVLGRLRAGVSTIAFQAIDHLVEPDVFRTTRKRVTSVRSARGCHHACPPQRHQHLVEEGTRNSLAARDLRALQRTAAGVSSQLEDGAKS